MDTISSADGTPIAYEKSGRGPALILVATTLADHRDLDGVASLLSEHFTVYNFDRRGRGDSGDPQPYDPRREVEDIEVLIDVAGGSAALASGSAGSVLALDAATALGTKVGALYLYEPPFIVNEGRSPVPADYVEHVSALVHQGKRSEAVEYFMVEAIGLPAEFLDPMKADPSWETMVSYAHTLAYDGQIVKGTQDGNPLPSDRWDVTAPAAVVVGSESETFFHDAAKALVDLLPNAKYTTLGGQDHSAFWMAPDVVANHITEHLQT
jgi:pimeloyl-ACP methyl ester carboxylesterase